MGRIRAGEVGNICLVQHLENRDRSRQMQCLDHSAIRERKTCDVRAVKEHRPDVGAAGDVHGRLLAGSKPYAVTHVNGLEQRVVAKVGEHQGTFVVCSDCRV